MLKKEYLCNGCKAQISHTSYDEFLMEEINDDFHLCPRCFKEVQKYINKRRKE